MKKILPLLLAILIATMLCACKDDGAESAEQFRALTEAAKEISFTAKLRAEYPDKTAEFELKYLQNGDGVQVSVVKPEIISGISAHINENDTKLRYDGAILDIGTLSANGLCPMSALPITVMAMKDAYVDSVWTEDELTVERLIPSDDTEIIIWLDEKLAPHNAEIVCDGNSVVFIEFSDWEMK